MCVCARARAPWSMISNIFLRSLSLSLRCLLAYWFLVSEHVFCLCLCLINDCWYYETMMSATTGQKERTD